MRKKQCQCNGCVYRRWWKRQQTRKKYGMKLEPRPVRKEIDPDDRCKCYQCLLDRYRSAMKRNREYLKVIERLKGQLQVTNDR